MVARSKLREVAAFGIALAIASGACRDAAGPSASPAAVSIADSSATLVPGDTLTLSATVTDSAGSELSERRVRWASSDSSIAAVSPSGRVRARADGLAWIYAASGTVADSTAILVVDPFVATQLSAGYWGSCAVQLGQGFCWGYNGFQQLGTGLLGGWMRSPTPVTGGLTWSSIALSEMHACGIASNATAYCWGNNIAGQLGDGNRTDRAVPVPVTVTDSLGSLGLMRDSSCGIRTPGFLICWEYSPAYIAADHVQGSSDHGCAWLTDGAATCWGSNSDGQLGDGSTTFSAAGVTVSGGLSFRIVSPGTGFTCGLTPAAGTYCWGANDSGQLGDGSTAGHLTPAPVGGTVAFSFIDAGYTHTCGLAAGGEAWCWGANYSGQLGDGTTTDRATPVPVTGGRRFSTLSAGADHSCGITTAGQVFCWGGNLFGQLGDNTNIDRTRPTPVPKP